MGTALEYRVESSLSVQDRLQAMVEQHKLYLDVCRDLLDESDYAIISKTKFRKRTGWAKLRRAFNVAIEVMDEQYIEHGDVWGYQFLVKAALPNGRTETGDGACFSDEFTVGRIRATQHNVRAKALTRAKNRATSDILGAGDVSAEEWPDEPEERQKPAPTTQAENGDRAWINNSTRRAAFWAWTKDQGLSHAEVHTALGVTTLKDYEGSPAMAQEQIENWLNNEIEAEKGEREAEAVPV